jgi:hypothetical protein
MIYIRVNNDRNNSIIDVSGDPFVDLQQNESQHETNFDFPTGQKYYYYRWNDLLSDVEVNDEDTIKSFMEDLGSLTGLDLEPHVEKVNNSEFIPNTTKTVEIEGLNFSPFSVVEISGQENFVNTTYFVSPKKINAEITVGNEEGLFNIIVKNDQLHSKDSGYEEISVKSKTIVDLRTADVGLLGLEMTNNIDITQDSEKGLRFTSNFNSWNRGVKFGAYSWNRADDITLEIVFTRTSNVLFMIGIASANLNVENINSAYYKQEIGAYHNNNLINTMYGGGDVTNWSQNIGSNVTLDVNKFYKIKFDFSGLEGYECSISEVDPDDWDDQIVIHSWISNCPADDVILTPFILPQASSGAYYITGFRY